MAIDIVERALRILSEWVKNSNIINKFHGFYTFGSLVDDDGEDFYKLISDIDLIVVFSEESRNAFERAGLCRELRQAKQGLEVELMKEFGRSDASKPIVSSVLLTKSEVIWDIHKSNNPLFFRNNHLTEGFRELADNRELPDPKGFSERETLWGFIQAFSETQAYRHRYLTICANQKPESEISGDDFPLLILRKNLMRCSAYVSYLEEGRKPPDNSFKNVIEGKSYLNSLLRDKSKPLFCTDLSERSKWENLKRKIERDNPDGSNPSHCIQPFDLLLLYELLFDKAHELFSNALKKAAEPPYGILETPNSANSGARTPCLTKKIFLEDSKYTDIDSTAPNLPLQMPLVEDNLCNNENLLKLACKAVSKASSDPSSDIVGFFRKLYQLTQKEAEAMGSLIYMESYRQSKADYLYEIVAAELPQDYKSFEQESRKFPRCNRKDPTLLESDKILERIREKTNFIKESLEKLAPTEELEKLTLVEKQSDCQFHYQGLIVAVDDLNKITLRVNALGGNGLDGEKLNECLHNLKFHTEMVSEYLKDISKRYREMVVEV